MEQADAKRVEVTQVSGRFQTEQSNGRDEGVDESLHKASCPETPDLLVRRT